MAKCPSCHNDFNLTVESSEFERKYICPILKCSVIYYLQDRTAVREAYTGRIEQEKRRILEEHNLEPRI